MSVTGRFAPPEAVVHVGALPRIRRREFPQREGRRESETIFSGRPLLQQSASRRQPRLDKVETSEFRRNGTPL